MRILILGGTGFIGPHVVRTLAADGHTVAVFHRGQTTPELPAGVVHLSGNRDRLTEHASDLRRFAPLVVLHLIAYVEDHARQMVEVFRGVAERTVTVSSGDVYRAYGVFHGTEAGALEPVPVTEEAAVRQSLYPYRPHAKGTDDLLYSYDKIPVERAAQSDSKLPTTVLRLPMVYGPGDAQRRFAGYLRRMTDGRRAIPLGETFAGWRCTRGYVEDVAAAIALAATNGRAAGRTYNVGETTALSETELVSAIGNAAGWTGEVIPLPGWPAPMPGNYRQDIVTDTTRIRRDLGFREVVPPHEALARAVRSELARVAADPPIDYAAEDAALAGRPNTP
jgi:nucleoside-diphosphate-sugar epimerase